MKFLHQFFFEKFFLGLFGGQEIRKRPQGFKIVTQAVETINFFN